jgi:endo-1,4-beta-xylanase
MTMRHACVCVLCLPLLAAPAWPQVPRDFEWPWDPLGSEAIQRRIETHRMAAVALTVLGADGRPLADAPVLLRQTRHQFLFGCNAFTLNLPDADRQKRYRDRFQSLFNYATLPFYWGAYEAKQEEPQLERLRAMARWCAEHGIKVKGHPLCWQQVEPGWLAGKSCDETLSLQLRRIRRDVAAFAGLVDIWDVVNEAVSMPRHSRPPAQVGDMCARVGQLPLIRQAFAAARSADPRVVLAINDYDISSSYEALLRDSLAAAPEIGVIGIQSHMHQKYWGGRFTWEICQRFARLGKPLQFTEITILAGPRRAGLDYSKNYTDWLGTPGSEEDQADQAAELYTVLFSHPAVEAITWWDFSDHDSWLGAPSGLLRSDMTPRPAYTRLHQLIKDRWWTEVRIRTNAAGVATFRGFLGDYAIESASGCGNFRLESSGTPQVVCRLKLQKES